MKFDECMVSNGFNRCYNCCVYFKVLKSSVYVFLLLYVDDMLLASRDREVIEDLKLLLKSEFDMKDLGKTNKILGMELKRNRRKYLLFLTQENYLKKVIAAYDITESKPVQNPLAPHFRHSNLQCLVTEEDWQEMTKIPYANAVGCLMYAMVLTRPDIAHAVNLVSRYMATPDKEHWRAVNWIMRYLNGTLNYGLVYG